MNQSSNPLTRLPIFFVKKRGLAIGIAVSVLGWQAPEK